MMKIESVFHPDQLYQILTALHLLAEMPAFTVTEVRRYPRGHGAALCAADPTDAIRSVDWLKLECVVSRSLSGLVVKAISDATHGTKSGNEGTVVYEVTERAPAGDSDEEPNPAVGPKPESR